MQRHGRFRVLVMSKWCFVSAALFALLSGCMGGAAVVGAPDYLSPAPAGSFNALVNVETRFLNSYYDHDFVLRQTSASQMPQNGTITYQGAAAFATETRETTFQSNGSDLLVARTLPAITGRAVLTANFTTDQVSGHIGDFQSADGSALPGRVTLQPADITANSYGSGMVAGSFAVDGTATTVTGGGHGGRFVGNDAAGIYGNVTLILPQPSAATTVITGTITVEK